MAEEDEDATMETRMRIVIATLIWMVLVLASMIIFLKIDDSIDHAIVVIKVDIGCTGME